MRSTLALTLLSALLCAIASGCGSSTTTPDEQLAQSCTGTRLDACEPYAFAVATAGTMSPDMLRIGDLIADAHVTASYRDCGAASPAMHSIRVEALATVTTPDAGTSQRSFFLIQLDDTDRDGELDMVVPNPFDTGLPERTAITLRFTPRIEVPVTLPDGTISVRSCNGAGFSTPYTTGERYVVSMDGGI